MADRRTWFTQPVPCGLALWRYLQFRYEMWLTGQTGFQWLVCLTDFSKCSYRLCLSVIVISLVIGFPHLVTSRAESIESFYTLEIL